MKMYDPLEIVEKVAARTCLETAFPLDVSDRVLSLIRQTPRVPVWPVVLVASGVVLAIFLILPLVDLFADPWSTCFVLSTEVL
jgi:hypothetical protein